MQPMPQQQVVYQTQPQYAQQPPSVLQGPVTAGPPPVLVQQPPGLPPQVQYAQPQAPSSPMVTQHTQYVISTPPATPRSGPSVMTPPPGYPHAAPTSNYSAPTAAVYQGMPTVPNVPQSAGAMGETRPVCLPPAPAGPVNSQPLHERSAITIQSNPVSQTDWGPPPRGVDSAAAQHGTVRHYVAVLNVSQEPGARQRRRWPLRQMQEPLPGIRETVEESEEVQRLEAAAEAAIVPPPEPSGERLRRRSDAVRPSPKCPSQKQLRLLMRQCVGCTDCLLYTSPSPRDATLSRMPSSA